LRNQNFSIDFLKNYKRQDQGLIVGIAEMYVQGVSTRNVSKVTNILFGESISKSTVSEMCKQLDPIVDEFRNRPLESVYPFVIIDAIYLKVRENNTVVSKALYVAIGVNREGFREIIGLMVADQEDEQNYRRFFQSWKSRGLEHILYIVSDNHQGLKNAITKEWTKAIWQRCQTHFSRNMLDVSPKKAHSTVSEHLSNIYNAPNLNEARAMKEVAVTELIEIAPKAATLLDDCFDQIVQVFALPAKLRKKMRTSNSIERQNEEIRKRARPIRIFPNEPSVYRTIGMLLLEQHERWISGHRYMHPERIAEFMKERGFMQK
jgi:transposase-like protein